MTKYNFFKYVLENVMIFLDVLCAHRNNNLTKENDYLTYTINSFFIAQK